jgi:ADP-dependent NAD(P)H-hydrate dehydratase / NAD(P)H-hydrate epimerase
MGSSLDRWEQVQRVVVTTEQMRAIESRLFDAGMPVAALMEKVAGLIAQWVQRQYPLSGFRRVGVLVGPGHNGGDALVVARELHYRGYAVSLCCPFEQLKELTASHLRYVTSLKIPCHGQVGPLQACDLLIDGLFGFGLERPMTDAIADLITEVNTWPLPRVSIDVPSGLHTDTGQVMGAAIRATQTLCLGLWKVGLLQDHALASVGQAALLDFDLPWTDIQAALGEEPSLQRVTDRWAIESLPLPRSAATHKYKLGHLLMICGSQRYLGAAFLAGLGARASGVGMLSIAVPASLKPLLAAQIPEALVIGCPETETGAIAHLPTDLLLNSKAFQAIACGPGLTPAATPVVQQVLDSPIPLILDADGLTILAQQELLATLPDRPAPTILTPHLGEFQRLFPHLTSVNECRVTATRLAAHQAGAIVLLKGARVVIADPQGHVRLNPDSTPALARGGSGDVLTGLLGGLLAQRAAPLTETAALDVVQSAVWWHAQAGILASQERTELGVDAHTLTQYLSFALSRKMLPSQTRTANSIEIC